ncbi:MAG: hypothetical protein H6720_10700 [Sandaracinus sp.]|nr:hypothetical protein [Sandaracinus sp.]
MIRGILSVALLTALLGCGEESRLNVERLPAVQPSLPAVPTLPSPPHPTTYPDGSYSVWGARARMSQTLDQEIGLTGYIVDVYTPPECDRRQPDCRVLAPHMWVADTRIPPEQVQAQRGKQIMVVGYAENQEQIDEAMEQARRGRYTPPDPESGLLPIPTDFLVGNKLKLTARFALVSSSGFNSSEGLLEYRSHTTLENVAAEE